MGTVQAMEAGCMCAPNAVIRALLRHLVVERDEAVVLDLEAGVEHIGRGTARQVDALLIIADSNLKSLEIAKHIHDMASVAGMKKLYLIGNRVMKGDAQRADNRGPRLRRSLPLPSRCSSFPFPCWRPNNRTRPGGRPWPPPAPGWPWSTRASMARAGMSGRVSQKRGRQKRFGEIPHRRPQAVGQAHVAGRPGPGVPHQLARGSRRPVGRHPVQNLLREQAFGGRNGDADARQGPEVAGVGVLHPLKYAVPAAARSPGPNAGRPPRCSPDHRKAVKIPERPRAHGRPHRSTGRRLGRSLLVALCVFIANSTLLFTVGRRFPLETDIALAILTVAGIVALPNFWPHKRIIIDILLLRDIPQAIAVLFPRTDNISFFQTRDKFRLGK